MGSDTGERRATIIHRARPIDQAAATNDSTITTAAVMAIDDPNSDDIHYVGYLFGLDAEFQNASLRMTVPRSLIGRADFDNGGSQLLIDGGVLADVRLREVPVPASPDQFEIVGAVFHDDFVVDVAAIDDPITLAIVVIGATTLICLAKLGIVGLLLDRAHDRATLAGDRPTLAIDTFADEETSVAPVKHLTAKLRCGARGRVYSGAGEALEEHLSSEPYPD